ncbi:MAG: hypothetical protein ABJF11_09135 [Reichenbachiella sp.]|uniref:phosphorylase family protein n=1 Tax=Reichenbachiella sp. TaxID=2184521 RepID=UPI0032659F53
MKQEGILSAKELIAWKMNNGALKVPIAPKHVIICPQQVLPTRFKSLWYKEISGLMGRHVCIDSKNGIYLSTGWGVGGSALVAVCEELYALGTRDFILIGMAGRLTAELLEGDSFYATSAFRAEGTSQHYLPVNSPIIVDCPSEQYYDRLDQIGLSRGRFCSTDAPFRETPDQVTAWTNESCTLVDMETASLYAFAKSKGAHALSIGVGADSLANGQWGKPKDLGSINSIIRKTVFQVIDLLA